MHRQFLIPRWIKSGAIILYFAYALLAAFPQPWWSNLSDFIFGQRFPSVQFFPWIEYRAFSSPFRFYEELVAQAELFDGTNISLALDGRTERWPPFLRFLHKHNQTGLRPQRVIYNPSFAEALCLWKLKNYNAQEVLENNKIKKLAIINKARPVLSEKNNLRPDERI